jgi:hypothetical protein
MRALSALACTLAAVPFLVVAACSSADPHGLIPHAYQPPGAATSAPSSPANNAPPPSEPGDQPGSKPTPPSPTPPATTPPSPTTTPTTTPTAYDAGSPPPAQDAGGGTPPHDAGGPGTTGPLGSCTNPACGTDPGQGYCGCTATDSNGNQVQLGCQPGGYCGCFVNQNLVNDTVQPENGLCADTSASQQQFFIQTCTCN